MNEITIEQTAKELRLMLDQYEWYYDLQLEGKSICVYVHQMGEEVQTIVPRYLYGHFVKLGFASYLTCGEKYNAVIDLRREASSDEPDRFYE